MSGRRLGKNLLTLLQHCSGAVMCPACLCGGNPAGQMLCADRVPIVSARFKVRWPRVFPIPGTILSALRRHVANSFKISNDVIVARPHLLELFWLRRDQSMALRCRGAGAVECGNGSWTERNGGRHPPHLGPLEQPNAVASTPSRNSLNASVSSACISA